MPFSASGNTYSGNIELSDGLLIQTYTFAIIIVNDPPVFASLPTDYIMNGGDKYIYMLSAFIDPEN